MEVAGERVETWRSCRAASCVLLTTARAIGKTRMPSALRTTRGIRKGGTHRLSELAAHLESIGFERVPMVEDVAQFSIRGGIFDVYSFGMAEPVRAEFWGDSIEDLRHFDLATQRSSRAVDFALVLPVDGHVRDDAGDFERGSIATLFPPDTARDSRGSHIEPRVRRAGGSRNTTSAGAPPRRDVPRATELFEAPGDHAQSNYAASARSTPVDEGEAEPDLVFPIRPPEAIDRDVKQLKRLVRDGLPTVILCDNEGQAERLDELLSDEYTGASPAALSIGVLDGGFVIPPTGSDQRGLRILTDHEIFRRERRIRRARRYISGTAALDTLSLKNGDYVVHLEHGVGIYRGITQIFVGQSTIEVAVVEYEGGDRLNVPLYRIDR